MYLALAVGILVVLDVLLLLLMYFNAPRRDSDERHTD